MLTPSTRSPGDRVLTMAASRPPDPAQESRTTSFVVPKNPLRPPLTRSSMPANSGPRWLIIWRDPASRTADGREVGPGIRRFVSKRFTGASGHWVEGVNPTVPAPGARSACQGVILIESRIPWTSAAYGARVPAFSGASITSRWPPSSGILATTTRRLPASRPRRRRLHCPTDCSTNRLTDPGLAPASTEDSHSYIRRHVEIGRDGQARSAWPG